MAVMVDGEVPEEVTPKDLILALISEIGTGGGQGHMVEYRGEAIEKMSMEGRMTICNMSIEWGARVGMVASDETTFTYLKDRPHAPRGAQWDKAVAYWRTLRTDDDAIFDAEIHVDASNLAPLRYLGYQPGGRESPLGGVVPAVEDFEDEVARSAAFGVHGFDPRHQDARHRH